MTLEPLTKTSLRSLRSAVKGIMHVTVPDAEWEPGASVDPQHTVRPDVLHLVQLCFKQMRR